MRLPMNTSLATLKPSGIRRINALAAQHPGCIALALGEPDFPTPDVISAEVTAALGRGDTHYPPNNGRPALREALSAYMGDAGLEFSADEVILTDGATEALSATFMAMLNPGDEVIIPTPAFGLYESIVVANHAKAVFLDTEPAQFQIDEDALRACVTPATKAIVICTPNNPTGCILNAASLDAVARVAEQAGIYVICDDVYNRLVYVDGYERFAQRHPELREQTVVIESFSKPWAMTGWRLGWLAAAAPVIAEIAKAHQYLVSSAVSFEMDAAANNGVDDIRDLRDETAYTPSACQYKVYIIDEVHMLSTAAFNALLKTLEEPPSYVIFILATTEVHKIPITILSRCQRYDFKRISIDTIAGRLAELTQAEQIDVDDRALRYVARAADGSMRDALSLLDQCVAFHFGEKLTYDNVLEVLGAVDNRVFGKLFQAVLASDTKACIREIEEMIIQGRDLSQLVNDFVWYMRNLLIAKTTDEPGDMLDMSEENPSGRKSAKPFGILKQ